MPNNIKKAHLIGIAGIGVSALARLFINEGIEISGSDINANEITRELKKIGVKLFDNHSASNLAEDTDLVVYSVAVPEDNPELVKARRLGIKTITYPRALGLVSKGKRTIAVSGTHGKTTTTAMIAHILKKVGKRPSVIVGSILKSGNSNFQAGDGDLFVVEACEYKRSFLSLKPYVGVITNIEEDHLDYYKDLDDITSAFSEFVSNIDKDGYLICDTNNEVVGGVLDNASCKVLDYSDVKIDGDSLEIPGKHNVSNAKAAVKVVSCLGVAEENAIESIKDFEGTWRRLDYKGKTEKGSLVYDDYAHHPSEVRATLQALNEGYKGKEIVAIFQPHLFSRTKHFLGEFAESFNGASEVIVLPIYAAREKNDGSISHLDLAREIKKDFPGVIASQSFEQVVDYINEKGTEKNLFVTLGAGDVYKIAEQVTKG